MGLGKKGKPSWNKGKHLSEETKKKLSIAKTGKSVLLSRDEKHHNWKGDRVGYFALHIWVKRRKQKPTVCEICGLKPPLDLANISQKYKRDLEDWEWICRSCHQKKDGRLKKLQEIHKHLKIIRDKKGRIITLIKKINTEMEVKK